MEITGHANHTHCATADPKDPKPWCYTTNPDVRWEYCDCDDTEFHNRIHESKNHCTETTTLKGIVMLHYVVTGGNGLSVIILSLTRFCITF